MKDFQDTLADVLLGTEFLAAFIGMIYFSRLKHSYWKWFVIYLIVIFIQEFFWVKISWFSRATTTAYYIYIGVPIQYLFFYWLYALKSQKNKILFRFSSFIFLSSLAYLNTLFGPKEVLLLSTNIAIAILIFLVILEYIKQIQKGDILRFKENKMFYINVGIIIFYIGSYPFQLFAEELHKNHSEIYAVYYSYFLLSNSIMYLLFTTSFIWGKTR